MSHAAAGAEDAHHFFQTALPVFEMLKHAVRDDEIERAIIEREGFRNGEGKPHFTSRSVFRVNRNNPAEAFAQKL